MPQGSERDVEARTQESLNTFTVDGFVRGSWRVDRTRESATLVVTPFRALSAGETAALMTEGDDLLHFLAAGLLLRDVQVQAPAP